MRTRAQQFDRTLRRAAWLAMAALVVAGASLAPAAEVRVKLSSRDAYVGMPIYVQLQIANASQHEKPTLPQIEGAKVRSLGTPSRSEQITIINGHRTQNVSLTYVWEITPLRAGAFTVPAMVVRADGQVHRTEPMTFTAQESQAGDLLFVDVVGDRQRAYVGQALPLRLRIWVRPYVDVNYSVRLDPEDMWGLVVRSSQWGPFAETVEELAQRRELPKVTIRQRNNDEGLEQSYYVYEIEQTIWPERPGPLENQNVTVAVQYPTGLEESRSLFSRGLRLAGTRPIARSARIEPIEILPIPIEGRPAHYNGAVGQFRISAEAQPRVVHAGDPVTLTLDVQGYGRLDALQAPPLAEMPELTQHFKVPREKLPGVVSNDHKFFVVNLQPLDETVTEIPPIPLVYFDPAEGEFKTATTEPIPLVVKPAEKLAMDAIVSNQPAGESAASAPAETPDKPRPLTPYQDPQVLLTGPTHLPGWTVLAGLIGPPGLFVGLVLGRLGWRAHRGSAGLRARQARRSCLQCLDTSRDADAIARCLLGYLADCTNRPPGAMTRREAAAILQSAGVNETLQAQVDSLLQRCQTHRYAGVVGQDASELAAEARQLVGRLDREVLQ